MSGFGIILVLILFSALPVIAVRIWFSAAGVPLRPLGFLGSLLAGILTLLPAALLQSLFPASWGGLMLRIFVRIALTEEAARLAVLALFFAILRRGSPLSEAEAAASGLVAGLGFAILETASYASAGLGIALLRAVTAAPLHGACGGRVACALYRFPGRPALAVSGFIIAVLLHGLFNFMVLKPGIPAPLPVILAAAALLPVLRTIQRRPE
ncbi:MAG: PrsW family intramembrane metalloprotease [Spirochaetaceae bacterium]|jgi:RsiW-degrading membrane proteinase PrsW (M82 family)|nr:PrsW family intramembrane metalloprotease [Spirochaetaceae bacterium]